MGRTDFSEMECSIARTLEVVGERWSLLIIRDAFYGVRRFEDFQRDLGIARNILTDRLKKLIEQGVLERRPYEERPTRYEYRLTESGRDLLPVLLTLMSWGDKWATGNGPPVKIRHLTCGHDVEPVLTCNHCHDELRRRDVRAHPIRIQAARGA
ncbi:MAG: winged helix-turn-helix transcriptional regulator [Actinomycetota bacterium]